MKGYRINQKKKTNSCSFYFCMLFIAFVWATLIYNYSKMSTTINNGVKDISIVSSGELIDRHENQSKTFQKHDTMTEKLNKGSKDILHIVFSTDCTPFQDWQSLVVFHSAYAVEQKGMITRIASGCNDDKKKELTNLYSKLWGNVYNVHFTPDFKKTSSGKSYDFYNKPYGLKHWLENSNPPIKNNVVVALIDPDFIFLRPITLNMAGEDNNIFYQEKTPAVVPEFIGEGVPAAQLYGLGAPWAGQRSRNFNREYICGKNSSCMKTTVKFGEEHYSVGPPYLVHVNDMKRLTDSWCAFVPKVYEGYPELLAGLDFSPYLAFII